MKNGLSNVPVWVPYVVGVSFIASFLFIFDFKYLNPWFNFLPLIVIILGVVAGGNAPPPDTRKALTKWRYRFGIFLSPLVILVLLANRYFDSPARELPAQFLHFDRGNFLAPSTVTIAINFPDGSEVHLPIKPSSSKNVLHAGVQGKAYVGQGFFGIPYLRSVIFTE